MKSLLARLLLVMLAVTIPAGVPAQDTSDPEQLIDQIDSLRAAADYAHALDAARRLATLRASIADTPTHEVEDARRLVATLERITALPEEARAEMSQADRDGALFWELYNAEEYDSALTTIEHRIEVIGRHLGESHAELGYPLRTLGYFLYQAGAPESAEETLRRAIDVDRAALGDHHPDLATDLDYLATVVAENGDYDEAESLLREALAIDRAALGEETEEYASKLNNLALTLSDAGDYAAAEPLYRRSLALHRFLFGARDEEVAPILNNLGELLRSKGDDVTAEERFKEALDIYAETAGKTHYYYAETLNNLAALYQDRDDYAAAEPFYQEALEIFRGWEDDESAGRVLNNLADLYHDQRRYDLSEALYRESLDLHRVLYGDEHPLVATITLNLARDLRDQGKYDDAEPLYAQALTLYRALLGDQHPYVAMCLYSYTSCIEARGDFERAVPLLRDAAVVFENASRRAGGGLARATFQKAPYWKLANALLATGRTDDAWPMAERQMGRVLRELLIAADSRPLTPEEAAEQDSLRAEIDRLEGEVTAYREALAEEGTEEYATLANEARNALLDAEASWGALQNEIAEKYPLTEGRAAQLADVERAIEPNAALIGWIDVEVKKGEFASWIYVLRHDGGVTWARTGEPGRDVTETDPNERAAAMRRQLSKRGTSEIGVRRDAREMWNERFAPVAAALKGVDELIVVPSGAMLGVPVDAVVDEAGHYLGERFTVSYAPSATLYAWLRARAREGHGTGRALLVGDPPFTPEQAAQMEREADNPQLEVAAGEFPDEDTLRDELRSALAGNKDALAMLPRLYGARTEIARIASLYDGAETLAGVDATEERLAELAAADELRGFDVIHVATHALVDNVRPERSALVLSQVGLPDPVAAATEGRRVSDGLVTAREVMRGWKLDADLVTLSACETGLGRRVSGEGYIGLAHAFLQAGARSVLVSLWKVDDRASSLLMQRFYANLRGQGAQAAPMPKARALREAKQWVRGYQDADGRRPFGHPYFWSAFVLIGDRG